MAERTSTISTEDVIHYHLAQIRKFGKGWRAPQVRQHRESIINLIKLRRQLRRAIAHNPNRPEAHIYIASDGTVVQMVTHPNRSLNNISLESNEYPH